LAGHANGTLDAKRRNRLMPRDRFECLQETPGSWMVWDHAGGAPARLGGVELRGQDKHRAEIARDILRRIFRTGRNVDAAKSDPSDA
jgi:hypothetical protein